MESVELIDSEATEEGQSFSQVGGDLSLDFVNTVSGRKAGKVENDRFRSYADLVAWGRQMGVLENREAERLLSKAERQSNEGREVVRKALALREAIYRVFGAIAEGEDPRAESLAELNGFVSRAMAHLQVAWGPGSGGAAWAWSADNDAFDRVLWPVARSAAELLVSADLEKVRTCASDNCGWLFLDRSKNHSRHWCDMRDCGNRAKAKRHYQRARAGHEQQ